MTRIWTGTGWLESKILERLLGRHCGRQIRGAMDAMETLKLLLQVSYMHMLRAVL